MAEAEDILRQVFLSEVDYAYAKQREAALLALPSRTAEEDAELALRQRQIAHDDTVIGQWLSRVATLRGRTLAQVRSALDAPANRAIRDAALESWRKGADAAAADKRSLGDAVTALPQSPEYAQHVAAVLTLLAQRLILPSEVYARLQERDTVAAKLSAEAQEREAYRDRIAGLKATVKSTWSP